MLGVYTREKQRGGKLAVISDSNVAPYYMEDCLEGLELTGYKAEGFVVPAGEKSKAGSTYMNLLEKLAECGMAEGDGIVALGGGRIMDLAGYLAATYLGGIKLYLVPTSLMAMLDYSLSEKFSIDLGTGRDVASVHYRPEMVLRDPMVLRTLTRSMMREGISEIIRCGATSDAELFEALEHAVSAKSFDIDLPSMIERCAAIRMSEKKAADLGATTDYDSVGPLNYGSSIASAIERVSNYSISHGFALAKGMDITSKVGARIGWCTREVYDRIHILLSDLRYDLSPGCEMGAIVAKLYEQNLQRVKESQMMRHAGADAKRKITTIRIAAPAEIGKSGIFDLELEELLK